MKSSMLSLKSALCWIVGSVFLCSLVFYRVICPRFLDKLEKQTEILTFLVQTGPQKEALPSDCLAELLDLSVDAPLAFSHVDEQKLQTKLLQCPVIQEATCKKIKPDILYIDYAVRKPAALVVDFDNVALDQEGVLFPMLPFFSPKKLPELYFGENAFQEIPSLGDALTGPYAELAFSLLSLLEGKGKDLFVIQKIDVSKAFAPSLGKREIVVLLENAVYPLGSMKPSYLLHFLRLSTKGFAKELAQYLLLRQTLLDGPYTEKERVIDLRIDHLAFID